MERLKLYFGDIIDDSCYWVECGKSCTNGHSRLTSQSFFQQLHKIMVSFSKMGKLKGEVCFGEEVSGNEDVQSIAKWKGQVHNWLYISGTHMKGLSKIQIWQSLGNGTPLQYSCLENPMDGGAWQAAVHGVAKGRTRLSDFTFTFHFHAMEKEMATHSSVLAWRIPGTAGPGGLLSMGSHRVGYD